MTPKEIQFCDVLRCIVVGVILFPAAATLKTFTVTIIFVDEPTLIAPPRCVPWVEGIHKQPLVLGFVLHEIFELPKGPLHVPLRER